MPWNGLDGLGNPVPSGIITVIVNFQAGRTNLPIYDIEDHPNGFVVRLVRPTINACGNPVAPPKLYWDDTNGTINMPTGTAIDGHQNLSGCTPAPPPPAYPTAIPAGTIGCHRFTGRGANGNSETINTWWYVAEDKITIPFFNDDSYVNVQAIFPNNPPCQFTDGSFLDVKLIYSDAKYNLSNFAFTITPTLTSYNFVNPTTNTPVVANASAGASNGPDVVSNTLVIGVPNKRHVTLRYKVSTGGPTLNNIGYNLSVSTGVCGFPQNNTTSIDCSSLMPIELADFRGINKGNVNLISWITASEKDNKGFGLERSTDGITFREIAFIAGVGNSNRLQRYSYEDLLEAPQTFYYRLRQVDHNGTVSYSKIIALTVNSTDSHLAEIYHDGNSTHIAIRTNFDKSDKASVTIYSLTGAVISRQMLEVPIGHHIQHLALPRAAKGVYFVEVRTSSGISKRHKIVY